MGKRNSAEQIAYKQSKTRLKWTEAMNTKLLECKREAKDLYSRRTANELLQSNVDNQETSSEDLEQDNYESNNDTISPRNLHSTNSQVPEENETPAEVKKNFQAAKLVFASVARAQGISASDFMTLGQRKDQQIKISSTSMRLLNS